MISQIIDKYLRKYHKIKTWQIYGNKTKYHFLDNPQISVDGEETHGVPSVEVYDGYSQTEHRQILQHCGGM